VHNIVDNVEITVQGGKGGDGAVSFHREKFAPRGGPDGGDGGDGGNVVLEADCNISDLSWFKSRRTFAAEEGGKGGGNKRSGGRGEDLVVRVPAGTLVMAAGEDDSRQLLIDLPQHGSRAIVARGGSGGWGNMHFAKPNQQTPMEAKLGKPGEERRLELDLRLMVDIVIVGPPNSGKSALLARISHASVKVAEYPFSTTAPVMGVVQVGYKAMVVAELPALMTGSHEGKGLGNRFLRQADRAAAVMLLVGGDSADPVADYNMLSRELSFYDEALARKPRVVAVNKVDLPEVSSKVPEINAAFERLGLPAHFISALTGQGVDDLVAAAARATSDIPKPAPAECPVPVLRPRPKARAKKEDAQPSA